MNLAGRFAKAGLPAALPGTVALGLDVHPCLTSFNLRFLVVSIKVLLKPGVWFPFQAHGAVLNSYHVRHEEFQDCQSRGDKSCMRNADAAFQNNNINHNQ